MKNRDDLVRSWLRKAASDALVMECSLDAGAFDAACFHAQQAAERCLKAYLVYKAVSFPYTHNLGKLVEPCAREDGSFLSLASAAALLTPYAVELRYDEDFWPGEEVAKGAADLARAIRRFVLAKLPPILLPGSAK